MSIPFLLHKYFMGTFTIFFAWILIKRNQNGTFYIIFLIENYRTTMKLFQLLLLALLGFVAFTQNLSSSPSAATITSASTDAAQ